MKDKTFRYALKTAVPVITGYLVLGVGFGILLREKGYPVWWSLLMGACMYAGSLQFVGIDLMASGADLLSAGLLSVMICARQLFYSLSMLTRYRDMGKWKPYAIFSITDETYSLLCDPVIPEGVDERRFYLYVSAIDHAAWVLGDVMGALLGGLLTFNTTGIDFAMTALFVVIFVEQWEKTKKHGPAILGVAVTAACRLVFGVDGFLIPAMLGITIGLFAMKKSLDAVGEEGGGAA